MVKSETNMGVRIGDILLYVIAKEFLLNKKNLLDLEAISFNAILPESQEDIQIMIDKIHQYDIKIFYYLYEGNNICKGLNSKTNTR